MLITAALPACDVAMPLGQKHQVGSVAIGADLPLSGDDAVDGLPVRDAIMLAISRAGAVCGASSHRDACVDVRPDILDDVNKGIHDPATGAANIKRLASEKAVLGVVGPLYDSVARSEIPVATAAGLPLISPANTDVCLTQEPPDGHCQGLSTKLRPSGANAYFRDVTTELSQGPAGAAFGYATLGKRHAVIVKDSSWLGQALTASFSTSFTRRGGKIVTDAFAADLVYFPSSDLPAVAAMRRTIGASNPQLPLLGADSLGSAQYALASGAGARGSYYTRIGPYPSSTRSAASFVSGYRQRFGRNPTSTDLAAFDATGVLISAISRAIDDAGGQLPTRSQVLRELAGTTSYAGAMGSFGFDAHGDTTLKWVSLFQWLAPTDRIGHFMAQLAAG
jgi:branched-chain amino acid transport system substrate-binding protein